MGLDQKPAATLEATDTERDPILESRHQISVRHTGKDGDSRPTRAQDGWHYTEGNDQTP